MAKGASTPTRVTADVVANAASVAPGENRTVTEQINHWLRIGMQVERSATASSRGVLSVIAGEAQFSTLSAEERAVAHAAIDARMAERVAKARFGSAARAEGRTTVSLDDDGNVVEIAPDGSRRIL